MTVQDVVSVVGLLGIGGIVSSYLTILWQQNSAAKKEQFAFMQPRYKCVLILMHTALDFEERNPNLRGHGRDFKNMADLLDELETEWNNMLLYASNEALRAVRSFIDSPTNQNFKVAAQAMRNDLWGGKIANDIVPEE